MRDFQNLLIQSKQNYESSRSSGFDAEIALQARLDYFRALLLKNNSYNMTKLKKWCIENQDLSFFELANSDVEYLMATNILYSEDGEIFKFSSQEDKDKLYDYQVKFIEKNATLIKLFGHTKDNPMYSSLTIEKEERFEREILGSADRIADFLTHVTKFHANSFGNSISTYLDSVDAKIDITLVKSEEEWRNISYDDSGVTINSDARAFVALNPVVLNGRIVGYSTINLFDISQTNLAQNSSSVLTSIPEYIILQRLKNALSSSKAVLSVVGEGFLDSKKSLSVAVSDFGKKLGEHYLIDEDERTMFSFAFSKSLGLDSNLQNIGIKNIKSKLKNVLSTLGLVNNELFLADIYAKNILDEDLYFKLGKKDAEVLNRSVIERKISSLKGDDRVQYGLGIDISKVKLRGSIDIAQEILEKEDVSISTDYKNLFLVTKKLTINSGNFAGKSFVLEDTLDDNEFKAIIAKEFLSNLVEKDMLKNRLNIKRIGDELKRNRELFDGQHTDIIGQLHDKRESTELSSDGNRGNAAEISAAQSGESDGYAQQLDGSGAQRERSVGDSEPRDSLYELASEIENQAHEQFALFAEKIARTKSKKELTEINYEINGVGFTDYKILEKDYFDLKKIIEAKFDLLMDEEAAASLDKDRDNLNIVEDENFTVEGDISSGGAKTKFKNYIAGIEVLRKIEAGEEIGRDDKIVLSKMPGIGTIAQAFPRSDGSVASGWENESIELKEVLSNEEYRQAQRATLDAYYTDENIIKAMWSGVERFGFKGGSVLEPSVGVGNFFGYMPKSLKPNTQLLGVELDKTTSKVAQILYPKAKIYNVGFENFQLLGGQKASLVIGNPPYGAHKIHDKANAELDGKNIHNYFMGKGVDSLEEGGVLAMVVSSSFLDSADASTRAYIGKSANLIGAIRLPKGSFGNANTEVVTDIVFLQKRDLGMESNIADWLNIGEVNETSINQYYVKNQENLLGIWGKYGTMYRGDEPGLVAREGQDTQKLLNEAIDGLPRFI
ncbi:MAG: hypothetical protein QG567_1661, partial [Campylobacterota bacterium]|nr:hypothetical protein [Campylobacterota bacterium]